MNTKFIRKTVDIAQKAFLQNDLQYIIDKTINLLFSYEVQYSEKEKHNLFKTLTDTLLIINSLTTPFTDDIKKYYTRLTDIEDMTFQRLGLNYLFDISTWSQDRINARTVNNEDRVVLLNELIRIKSALEVIYSLQTIIDIEQDEINHNAISQGNSITELYFKDSMNVTNLSSLSKTINIWKRIFRGFASLANEHDDTYHIEFIEKGSLSLTISGAAITMLYFSVGATKVSTFLSKKLQLHKFILDILSSENPYGETAVKELQKSAEVNAQKDAEIIADEVIKDTVGTVSAEVKTEVTFSIKEMIKMIALGGQINVKLLSDTNNSDIDKSKVEKEVNDKQKEFNQLQNDLEKIDGAKEIKLINSADDNDIEVGTHD